MAHATEVDAVMEAENKKTTRKRGAVQVVGSMEEDPLEEIKKLKGELEKALANIHTSLATRMGNRQKDCKDEKCFLKDAVCYGCNEKGHVKRSCLNIQKRSCRETYPGNKRSSSQ